MSESTSLQAGENAEVFEKLNDYTISATHDFARQEQADPELRRIFNFAAQNITTIYSMWYSRSVTSSMHVEKFSDLDSLDEVRRMHAKLHEMGGHPPPLPAADRLGKSGLRKAQNG
jgi:negative regulator of replication initiation